MPRGDKQLGLCIIHKSIYLGSTLGRRQIFIFVVSFTAITATATILGTGGHLEAVRSYVNKPNSLFYALDPSYGYVGSRKCSLSWQRSANTASVVGAATIRVSWRLKPDHKLDLPVPTNWMQMNFPWILWLCRIPVYMWVLEIVWW